jgi:hypothetical protein
MSRRLAWTALLAAGLVLAGIVPSVGGVAAAVGPFGPPEVLIGGCQTNRADAAIAVDGTTRGFANCTGNRSGPIHFFRDTTTSAPAQEVTPYTGAVFAVAWDGQNSTYVVFQHGTGLFIGKRVESTGAYSPLTTLTTTGDGFTQFTADVVAVNGQWWAVWSETVGPADEFAQSELFQRRTLLGVQGRTRITTTAANIDDRQMALAYASGRMTMVWSRTTNPTVPGPSDLRIAESTGGAWLSRPFASLGDQNQTPDVTIYAGITWVTWTRDAKSVVANNSGGTFHSRTFLTTGFNPTIAVSGNHTFVAWSAVPADRAVLYELAGGVWTSGYVDGTISAPLRVLAQATKARVVYERYAGGFSALYIRTQI